VLRERWVTFFHFASPASPPDYMKFPIETLMKVGSIATMHALDLALASRTTEVLAALDERMLGPTRRFSPAKRIILGPCESRGAAKRVRR